MPSNAPTNPFFYPIGLNLAGKTVLIVGAGQVASRKLTRLLQAGCHIDVVSADFAPAFQAASDEGRIKRHVGVYHASRLDQLLPDLVFACTNDPAVNRQICQGARLRGIWVNSATEGATSGDFIVPSLIEYDALKIALFSGGSSPAFLRRLRETLEAALGQWVGPYLSVISQVRQAAQEQVTDEAERNRLYAAALDDETLLNAVQTPEPDIRELTESLLARLGLAAPSNPPGSNSDHP